MSGHTTVTNGDAVVRIDERGNVQMHGQLVGFEPGAAGKPRTLPYDVRTVSLDAVMARIQKRWEQHRTEGVWRTSRWPSRAELLTLAVTMAWGGALGYLFARAMVSL